MSLKGFYVSFSGESTTRAITNVYALSPDGKVLSKTALDPGKAPFHELRGMAFGPDGNFYVAQAYKKASAILQFAGATDKGASSLKFLASFVTPSVSSGLSHPYQPIFDADGNLFVSSQDTNVVTAFYGPKNAPSGKPMPNARHLQKKFPSATFYPGTFVPAFSAKPGAPSVTPVPVADGGLTFKDNDPGPPAAPPAASPAAGSEKSGRTHSVRGLAFDGDHNLYVADEGADRVATFDAQGKLLGVISASKNHALNAPVALCFAPKIGPKGTLVIGSPGNDSLFVYDVSGVAKGDFVAKALINRSDNLKKLSGIAVDSDGNVYTGERESNSIHRWSPDGAQHVVFAGPFTDSPEQILAVHTAIVGG
jgi:sugar lactone lactonase YvrE